MTATEVRFKPGEAFDASEGVLTAAELAEMYKVDPKTASRWGQSGRVPHIRTPGNHFRFSRAYHRRQMEAGGD